jgi:signal transduction histidine kinase
MLDYLITKIRKHSFTAVLTAAVLGALLLQLSLLSGELELQRQQYETHVGQTASDLSDRVRMYVRRRSLGQLKQQSGSDSTYTITTPMGTTTLQWSNGQVPNEFGLSPSDSAIVTGFLDNFQSSLPWQTQLTSEVLDSIIHTELRKHGVSVKPKWAIVENGYISDLYTNDFEPSKVTFNYVLAESFFGPSRQLLLYFPSEKFFLAKRVYLSLLAALLFATVILVAFFMVQRQGQRQKRLADVKSDFINNMSHEFKTPLATINLAVDSLMKNGAKMNSDQMQSYLEIIKMENKRMNAQMESVLQMSLMDKEELTLSLNTVLLEEVVTESVDHFKLTVQDRGGWIDLQLPLGSFPIIADRIQLKSALTNLIDNAIKYSPDAPQISIRLDEEVQGYKITVKDRGIGMDSDTTRQVCDRFFRATKGNIHDVKGHGLGLTFVKEIVNKHQGEIHLSSELGKGSTFVIQLPKP